jgi:hypothetical protein
MEEMQCLLLNLMAGILPSRLSVIKTLVPLVVGGFFTCDYRMCAVHLFLLNYLVLMSVKICLYRDAIFFFYIFIIECLLLFAYMHLNLFC